MIKNASIMAVNCGSVFVLYNTGFDQHPFLVVLSVMLYVGSLVMRVKSIQ